MATDVTKRSFGQSISDAFGLVSDFIEDCITLLDTLRLLMEENGWVVEKSTKSGSDRLNGDFYRLYLPEEAEDSATPRIAIFQQVRVRKTDSFDEPQIVLVACAYTGAVEVEKVWNRWSKQGGIRVIELLCGRGGTGSLIGAEVNPEFALNAARGVGLVLPLCSLSNREMLQTRVIDPILHAAREVGADSKP